MKAALVAYLKTKPSVTTIAGNRIYPMVLPQKETRPSLVYQVISRTGNHHLGGAAGLPITRMQITANVTGFQTDRTAADLSDSLADGVRLAMDGFRGFWGNVEVTGCEKENEVDDFEEPIDASDQGVFRVVQVYLIFHREQIPQL